LKEAGREAVLSGVRRLLGRAELLFQGFRWRGRRSARDGRAFGSRGRRRAAEAGAASAGTGGERSLRAAYKAKIGLVQKTVYFKL